MHSRKLTTVACLAALLASFANLAGCAQDQADQRTTGRSRADVKSEAIEAAKHQRATVEEADDAILKK
ncbi:MAG: hypothetical protein ACJ8HI_22880 [Massilia sp.]